MMYRIEKKPILGAALKLATLKEHAAWLIDDQRDVEIQDFLFPDMLDGDWAGCAKAICAVLDGHTGRRGIHGPFFGLDFSSQDKLVRDLAAKRLLQGLDAAQAVCATHMVIHSPFTHWDDNNFADYPSQRTAKFECSYLTLAPIVKRAEEMGLTLVIENCDDKDPEIRVELARSFNSDAVRVSIDTGHAHYAHVTNGAPPVDHFVARAGAMLAHVHIQDADGHGDRHWTPGRGNINWHTVFAALANIDANPRLVIEIRDHSLIREGADHLIKLGVAQ